VLVFAAVLTLCFGGVALAAAVNASNSNGSAPPAATGQPADAPSPTPVGAPSSASPSPRATPSTTKQTVTETEAIAFTTTRVNDTTLAKGTTKVRTHGVAGVRTLTYEVTYTDGVQTNKVLVRSEVTKQPVTEVVAVGTKQSTTAKCDPNYSGACVPIASDVDCAGGGGNGPAYVQGPVRVIGRDIYGLDNDGDGIGCE
jgi:resuscitation-promoting factor RpfB